MKKLALAAFFVVAFIGFANAHNGALSLYADPNASVNSPCNMSIGIYQTDSIYLYYVRGNGPDIGNGIEFAMVLSDPDASFDPLPVWRAGTQIVIYASGDSLQNGVSIVWGPGCLGLAQPIAYLGKIFVFYGGFVDPVPRFTARVIPFPWTGNITILRCDPPEYTEAIVDGGTFVFNGSCNPGVESKSWGAIKALYR